MGAFVFYSQEKWLFGFTLTIVALANLYVLNLGENKMVDTAVGLNILNAIVSGITAYDYYLQGTKGLHLMWIFIAILYTIVTVIFFIKNRQEKNEYT